MSELSNGRIAAIIGSMYFGVFLSALDGTVVTSLLSHIASDLKELSRVSWIATAYLIALATFQPLYGKLSDIYGRKELLLFCNFAFALGCSICSISYDLRTLVIGRAISGIGGGGMLSLSTIAVSDLIPLRHRGIFQGVGNICFGAGAGVGGIFGGIVTDKYGWRPVFSLQVPAIVLSMVLLLTFFSNPAHQLKEREAESLLRSESSNSVSNSDRNYGTNDDANAPAGTGTESPRPGSESSSSSSSSRLKRIDFAGSIFLVATLLTLMFGLSTGGNQFAWISVPVITSVVLAVVFGVIFTRIELRAKEPVIALSLLVDPTVLASSLTNLFATMAVYTILFYAPIFFASVLDMNPTAVGRRLVANFLGVAAGSFGSGIIMSRTGRYYWLALISGISLVAGSVVILIITPDTPPFLQYLSLAFTGTGYSAMLTVTLLALIAAVSQEEQATATSIQYVFRGIGSTLGVSIASSLFHNLLVSQLHQNVKGELAKKVIERVLNSVEAIREVPAEYQPAVLQSYSYASKGAILSATVLGSISIFASAFMREHELHSTLERPTDATVE